MIDKYLHCAVSALLVIIFSIFLPLWAAALITLAIGVGKEYIVDLWIRRTKADWWDILADCCGVILGIWIIILL